MNSALDVYPLNLDRRPDFERLFGPHGAYGRWWCMWSYLPRAEFEHNRVVPPFSVDKVRTLPARPT
jgi:hypothetical protein